MRVVSLFSGCGGLDLGLRNSGHQIVYASDIDKDSCISYTKYFRHTCECIDVKNISSSMLPTFDLLVGGFPCQGFSIANLYRNEKDSRNELYLQIVRLLNESSPNFFMAENVPGILSLGKGSVVKTIMEEFENCGNLYCEGGYEVRKYLLNAADYGVPQNRKRVIFLGISKRFNKDLRTQMFSCFPPSKTNTNNLLENLPPHLTLSDAIGDLPEPYTQDGLKILNHFHTKHKVKINGYIGNRELKWNKPSPTIVGRGGGTGGPVIAVHPNLMRRFTVRETARIQTFPDDYEFYGALSSQYRQIGNAVAVKFAEALGLSLRKIEDKLVSNEVLEKVNFVQV